MNCNVAQPIMQAATGVLPQMISSSLNKTARLVKDAEQYYREMFRGPQPLNPSTDCESGKELPETYPSGF